MASAFRVDDQIHHADAGDDPGRRTQSTPSLPNAKALHLGYRWQKASDDTLVMDWYFADTKAQACLLISKPEAQPPERERNEDYSYQRPPTTRMSFAVKWIGIAIILGGSGVLTLMSFLIEHNDLL
ncbi:MAG: hypothetical protein ACLP4V_15975 [Methylocella sp.]